jgi:hypothetical protein
MPESERELWLLQSDIARFRSLLKTESDAAKRQAIAELLSEAEHKHALFLEKSRAPVSAKATVEDSDRVRRFRLKAEECRTIADQMKDEAARMTLLQLARSYERLAKTWEKADGRGGAQDEQEAS